MLYIAGISPVTGAGSPGICWVMGRLTRKTLLKCGKQAKAKSGSFLKRSRQAMKQSNEIVSANIQSMIFTIRGVQVMVDSDLAAVYEVETKILNRAVKRNIDRFPESFRFQLTEKEYDSLRCQIGTLNEKNLIFHSGTSNDDDSLRSQIVTSSGESLRSQIATTETGRGKHRKYLPYVFTEQGVSMLSAVLRSDTAVKVSIQIINAFVEMRRFIQHNASVFARLDSVERRQLVFESETEKNFEKVFQALERRDEPPRQGIFYNGQVYDAWRFASDLVRKAKNSLVLIDNYFVIIDGNDIYHIGASLKDLGKKWFAFSKMDLGAVEMLGKLEKLPKVKI
jgi:hypothetical protein